jgi:ABC-type multidrug transport system fused ATPase/permease subunit
MPSLLQTNLDELKKGTGSAFSQFFNMFSMIISALIVGFIMEPKLAGIFLALFPIYMCTMGFLGGQYMAGQIKITKAYSMSNGYAQQALDGIKVVHTYGREKLELDNYKKYL